ncbi:MAG: hypothetical protein AABY22_15615 [Nanoarchaeota archaeon]
MNEQMTLFGKSLENEGYTNERKEIIEARMNEVREHNKRVMENKLKEKIIIKKDDLVNIYIERGKDSKGQPDFFIRADECNVAVHNSGIKDEKEALEWIKGFLLEDGYYNFKIIEVDENDR